MNPRIWKEVRSLLPAFTVTVAATVLVAVIFDGRDAWGMVSFVFGGGCVMMGACSFGNEFYTRTMTSLLAQPISRKQLWAEKLQVLAGALVLAYVVWSCSVGLLVRGEGRLEDFTEVPLAILLIPVIVFGSAPLISLLFRNIIGSMAMTALMPIVVWLLILAADWLASYLFSQPQVFFAGSFEKWPGFYIAGLALGYSVVAYWIGWKYFLRFQSLDSRATEIKIPDRWENRLAPIVKRLIPGYSGPSSSLIRKELGLQRVSFLLAGLLCIYLPLAAAARAIHLGDFTNVMLFAPFFIYLSVIPLITGVVCLAEERNFGTTNWQFTLPPSTKKQWRVKLLVTFSTCIGLGVALPGMLSLLWAVLQDGKVEGPNEITFWIFFGLGYLVLFSALIFASSISTNSMRAIIAYLGLLCGAGTAATLTGYLVFKLLGHWLASGFVSFHSLRVALWGWVQNHDQEAASYFIRYLTTGAIALLLGCLMIWFIRMASHNFRNGELNSKKIRWQLSKIFAVAALLSLIVNGLLDSVFPWSVF